MLFGSHFACEVAFTRACPQPSAIADFDFAAPLDRDIPEYQTRRHQSRIRIIAIWVKHTHNLVGIQEVESLVFLSNPANRGGGALVLNSEMGVLWAGLCAV
jgi:hypothetical protein